MTTTATEKTVIVRTKYNAHQIMAYHTNENLQISLQMEWELDRIMGEFIKQEKCAKVLSVEMVKIHGEYKIQMTIMPSDFPFDCYWVNIGLEKIGIKTLGEEYA